MSYPRPKHEDKFVASLLEKEIRALGVNPELQGKFLAFAEKEASADPAKLKPRLYHVLHGRTPTAYLALLIAEFFWKQKYQDVIRKNINDVEYVTTDGDTAILEGFVKGHPLSLQIIRAKMLRFPEREPDVSLIVRSPIQEPNFQGLSEEAVDSLIKAKDQEFNMWLNSVGDLPYDFTDVDGRKTSVHYCPSWAEGKVIDEFDFEYQADLSARVDIWDVSDLMDACISKRIPSGYSDDGTDLFFALSELFGRDWRSKKISDYQLPTLWGELSKRVGLVPWTFFRTPDRFPKEMAECLTSTFDAFAASHTRLAARLEEDRERMDTEDEEYRPEVEVFDLYEAARRDFMESIKKAIGSKSRQFFGVLLTVLSEEDEKAQVHFSKLKAAFS